MKKIILLAAFIAIPLIAFCQNAIVTKDNQVLSVKILEVNDSSIFYQRKAGKQVIYESIPMRQVESYALSEGICFKTSKARKDTIVSFSRDTIVSYVVSNTDNEQQMLYLDNQRKEIANALKTTGTVSLSVGVPCLAAGIGCLLYANLLPSATAGYTTSKAAASMNTDLTYISVEEYIRKMESYNGKVQAASTAGYILTPLGGALTIVGIPLYVSGKKIADMEIKTNVSNTGLTFNF